MFLSSTNIFCQPTAALTDISLAQIEWSADGVTYQASAAPANTDVYLRVTVPSGIDVSTADKVVLSGTYNSTVTVAGQILTADSTVNVPPTVQNVFIYDATSTLLYTAGQMTFA